MNQHNLIDMANQIGEFFASMPDRDEGLAGVADHIRRFWEPRMRRALLDALADPAIAAAQRATPFVRDAIGTYRQSLTPAAQSA